MGASKTTLFSTEQNQLASIAKALGHPARIAILQYLLSQHACFCGDIVAELGLAQSTSSQHLRELKNIGLIQGTIEGKGVCYCINSKVWNRYGKILAAFFTNEKDHENCC